MNKGKTLLQMKLIGLPVPDLILLEEQLDNRSITKLNNFVKTKPVTTRFAVRSSSHVEDGKEASFAGLFETFLNVCSRQLHNAILSCFISKEKQIVKSYKEAVFNSLEKEGMDVIVQVMCDADVSGVMFSVNPITKEKQYVIECVYGLCNQLVSGLIEGDQIIYNSFTEEILSYKVFFQKEYLGLGECSGELKNFPVPMLNQSRKKVSGKQISLLTKTAAKIQQLLQTEIDVEWCFVKDKLFILQARPLTGLT